MVSVSAADLAKRFGRYRDLAQREPVSVTHHGRETVVLLSADEYRRLKSFDDREVYLAHELPAEWVAELEKPVPPYETELDHLMEPEGPQDAQAGRGAA